MERSVGEDVVEMVYVYVCVFLALWGGGGRWLIVDVSSDWYQCMLMEWRIFVSLS